MSKWTINNGPDGPIAVVKVVGDRVSVHVPPREPVELTPDEADRLASALKAAVGVARQG
jgi:hypothetical protein